MAAARCKVWVFKPRTAMAVVAMEKLRGQQMTVKKKSVHAKLMEKKTTSKVPKSAKEKSQWIQARRKVVKSYGSTSEKDVPWGVVQKIYKNEKQAGKVMKESDITGKKKKK